MNESNGARMSELHDEIPRIRINNIERCWDLSTGGDVEIPTARTACVRVAVPEKISKNHGPEALIDSTSLGTSLQERQTGTSGGTVNDRVTASCVTLDSSGSIEGGAGALAPPLADDGIQ